MKFEKKEKIKDEDKAFLEPLNLRKSQRIKEDDDFVETKEVVKEVKEKEKI